MKSASGHAGLVIVIAIRAVAPCVSMRYTSPRSTMLMPISGSRTRRSASRMSDSVAIRASSLTGGTSCYVSPMDPLAGSSWSSPATVAGFVRSPPNGVLVAFAEQELKRGAGRRALDIGCGAGRNAIPLATLGWNVLGTDLSWPMLEAAMNRARSETVDGRFHGTLAPMEQLPVRDRSIDLVIAHGIWNLARSTTQFRLSLDQ